MLEESKITMDLHWVNLQLPKKYEHKTATHTPEIRKRSFLEWQLNLRFNCIYGGCEDTNVDSWKICDVDTFLWYVPCDAVTSCKLKREAATFQLNERCAKQQRHG